MDLSRTVQGLSGGGPLSGFAGGLAGSTLAGTINERDNSDAPLLLRAMIAATASDGHMDDGEQGRVFKEAGKLNLSQDEKARLFDELQNQ